MTSTHTETTTALGTPLAQERLTEQAVQLMLSHYCWTHSQRVRLPNSNVLGWESDMVGVTKAGIMHEYEIKLSVSDFRADKKKQRHDNIERFVRGERTKTKKSQLYGAYTVDIYPPANYFWYVIPEEIAEKVDPELPGYAGLIVVGKWIKVKKKAPRLHRGKITDKQLWQMMGSACGRFWAARRILTEKGIPFTESTMLD